ncbi:hypothetical protein ACFZDJ_10695 [Streptomyces sp. NPDC007896]|uniref:hypothetical protein n=1 Tax=unclassified Streptomyces TaxID=2593676 RepID=UPI0036E072F8
MTSNAHTTWVDASADVQGESLGSPRIRPRRVVWGVVRRVVRRVVQVMVRRAARRSTTRVLGVLG